MIVNYNSRVALTIMLQIDQLKVHNSRLYSIYKNGHRFVMLVPELPGGRQATSPSARRSIIAGQNI